MDNLIHLKPMFREAERERRRNQRAVNKYVQAVNLGLIYLGLLALCGVIWYGIWRALPHRWF